MPLHRLRPNSTLFWIFLIKVQVFAATKLVLVYVEFLFRLEVARWLFVDSLVAIRVGLSSTVNQFSSSQNLKMLCRWASARSDLLSTCLSCL